MPSGYTNDIYDGKEVTVKQYILKCARAFGALVHMREDSLDVEIPDEIKPDGYYLESLEKEITRKQEFINKSDEELQMELDKYYENKVTEKQESNKRNNGIKDRYFHMIEEIEKWEAPSPDHVKLKKFAINQLEESMKFDCYIDVKEVIKPTLEEFKMNTLSEILKSIEYYTRNYNDEVERAADRTKWIKALKESLKTL